MCRDSGRLGSTAAVARDGDDYAQVGGTEESPSQEPVGPRDLGRALERVRRYTKERNIAGLVKELDNPLGRGTLTVAGRAAQALAELDERRFLPEVRELLSSDSAGTRFYALVALETFRDVAAEEEIAHCLNDPERIVRASAAHALTALALPSASEALRRLATTDLDEAVRYEAAVGLVTLGDRDAGRIVDAEIERAKLRSWRLRRSARRWKRLRQRI
jgi:HEAT repeat protein